MDIKVVLEGLQNIDRFGSKEKITLECRCGVDWLVVPARLLRDPYAPIWQDAQCPDCLATYNIIVGVHSRVSREIR